MADKTAQLNIDGKSFDFQIKSGVIGPDVIDISSLYAQTGMFTYDPGFTSTASCNSEITFIDGGKGQLLHRGYAIESLADHGDFLETCYLLLYGDLPNAPEKKTSLNALHTTRCCTSRWRVSSLASAVMRTQWQLCVA